MPHLKQKGSDGTRVKYRLGEKIEFPDFTIQYVGEHRKTLPVYPRGFLYYDFKVSKGKTEKVVSWTTGTGVIDPTDFEIDGKHYQLELRHSDKLGKLKENDLVVWQANRSSLSFSSDAERRRPLCCNSTPQAPPNFLPLNPQDDLLHPTTRHGRRCKSLPAFFPESHSDRRLASLCMRVCDAFAQQEFRRRRSRGGARRVRNCLAAHSLDRNSPCCSALDF